MKFEDNFSEILLISDTDVFFYCEDPYLKQNLDFSMHLLSIRDTLTNPYIQISICLLNMTNKEIADMFKLEKEISLWEVLCLLKFNPNNSVVRKLSYLMRYIFEDVFVEKEQKWFLQDIEVDQKLFERIGEVVLISSGMKNFKDQDKFKIDKPKWLIEKEREIARIKNQGKGNKSSNQHFEGLMKILVPLSYEFSYSLEELFNMNYFHIQFLAQYIPKIVGYDIQKRQVFSKSKIKYITDK